MTILVGIESDNNAKVIAKKTLRWAGRAGFDIRVFIPDQDQLLAYLEAVDEVNYQEYLDIKHGFVSIGKEPKEYAKSLGYDLLVLLPDNLTAWKRNNDRDLMVINYAAEIGAARKKLAAHRQLNEIKFKNGAIMVRL